MQYHNLYPVGLTILTIVLLHKTKHFSGEVDINDHKAVFEFIANFFTTSFKELCFTRLTSSNNITSPLTLRRLAKSSDDCLVFSIVMRVMILKVLLLNVRIGKVIPSM